MGRVNIKDDLFTHNMPAGSGVYGRLRETDPAPTLFSREAISDYVASALASIASSGSASDLTSGTVPSGRLHAWLADISNIQAPAVGDVILFDGSNFVNGSIDDALGSSLGLLSADNNLSDLANAGTARGNLGLGSMAVEDAGDYLTAADITANYLTTSAIAAAYQPLDSDLSSIAGLSTTTYGRSLLTLANSTALAAEVDGFFLTPAEGNAAYQPLDSDLTTLGGLSKTDGGFIVGDGSAWTVETGSTARTSLGLGTMATQSASSVAISGGTATLNSLFVGGASGVEGGEIVLSRPVTTSLGGDVVIDVASDQLRVFESGGSLRGAYLPLTALDAGAGTELFSSATAAASIRTTAGLATSDSPQFTAIDLINASFTQIDGASWGQSTNARFGSNWSGTGNQFGAVFQHNVVSPTGATGPYEKAAILSIAMTNDPSTSYDLDVVGIDARGYIAPTNSLGRAWGVYGEGRVISGGDGLIYAGEFYIHNDGSAQNSVDTTTSKYAVHLVSVGSNIGTAGLYVDGPVGWRNGIYIKPTVITGHLIRAADLFGVDPSGNVGGGTATPDRAIHGEISDSATNTTSFAVRASHVTSGTAAAGFGVGYEYEIENASGTNVIAARTASSFATPTGGSETSSFYVETITSGSLGTVLTANSSGVYAPGAFHVYGTGSADALVTLGQGRSGDANCYFDFHPVAGDSFKTRFIRYAGANGAASITNLGTGEFSVVQADAGDISFWTANTKRLLVAGNGDVTVRPDVATPANGGTSARLLFGSTSGFGIYYGSGAPTVSAAQGSIYLRSDGSSTSTRLYVNTNGTTGWTNVTTAT